MSATPTQGQREAFGAIARLKSTKVTLFANNFVQFRK